MNQTAHIAQNRCQLLLELLYIQSSVQRPRLSSDFLSCQKTAINKYYRTTHLSAGKLSGLMILPVTFFSFVFCHRILRSHVLKIKISKFFVLEPIQTLTNICYLDSVQSSRCLCVFVKKSRVVSCRFVVMELKKILSFQASKYPMKL